MKYLRLLLFPFALLYGGVVVIRNFLYDVRFFRSVKFSIPVICIGNLSMGGTGKTPHTEYLLRLLKGRYRVATLSRGFGRKERGFRIAGVDSTALSIGDEPMQYYKKFGNEVTVAVEADRVMGIMEICTKRPDTWVVLLDDAYQHRAVQAGLNILLTSYDDPFYRDLILPVGNLRELRRGKNRADIIVITKCPEPGSFDRSAIVRRIRPAGKQAVFFSRVRYGGLQALSGADMPLTGTLQIILVTGIANADPLKTHLAADHEILHHFSYRDHHVFTPADLREIHNLFDKFAGPQTVLVTTEKDAMRLMSSGPETQWTKYPWYYQSIEVEVDEQEKFDNLVLDYVERNS